MTLSDNIDLLNDREIGAAPNSICLHCGEMAKRLISTMDQRRPITDRWNIGIRNISRSIKNNILALKFSKRNFGPYPDVGYALLADAESNNGLSRAYRYEIQRLETNNLINPDSRNILVLAQPSQLRRLLRNRPKNFDIGYRIGLWVTESNEIPFDWNFALRIFNEIWTPSTFSALAFQNLDIPVKIVPHAVRLHQVSSLPRTRFGIPEDAFLGLAIMDLATCPERKNPLAHIVAWQSAFGNDPNAYLLIKARFSQNTSHIRQEMSELIDGSQNIRLIEFEFSDQEMTAFQKMADVYLSLHRAEGYGLCVHEMLELGVPTVATAWSGNMDFMFRYQNAHAIHYQLWRPPEGYLQRHGKKLDWAEPDVEMAAAKLRQIKEHSLEYRGAVSSKFLS